MRSHSPSRSRSALPVSRVPGEWRDPSRLRRTYRNELRAAADARPLALFIGDSYTAGKSSAELSYGCRAAVQMGWLCALSAMGGTGYISGGSANRWVDPHLGKSLSFSERIPHLSAQYDPALVVLDGGRNDDFVPRNVVFDVMVSTIAEVRRTWPEARIIFIRPRFLANPGDSIWIRRRLHGAPAI